MTNGSFETGDFTGWTVTGNATVENSGLATDGLYAAILNPGSSLPNAVLSQQFTVTVGQPYELVFSYGATAKSSDQSILASIIDDNGDYLVYSGFGVNPGITPGARTHTAIFVPTTPLMTVSFQDTSSASTSQDGLLDNVSIVAITPFAHSGVYVGEDIETVSYYGHKIISSNNLSVKMEIDTAGRMLGLLGPAFDEVVGTINNAGEVTLGTNNDFSGTATFPGPYIIFDVTEYSNTGGNFTYSTLVRTRRYILHRLGPEN